MKFDSEKDEIIRSELERGTMIKSIAYRLGCTSVQVTRRRIYLGLPKGRKNWGENGHGHRVVLFLTNDDYEMLNYAAARHGASMRNYLKAFIRTHVRPPDAAGRSNGDGRPVA